MTAPPPGFYVATYTSPPEKDPLYFMVSHHSPEAIWGLSCYRRSWDYRTLGIEFTEWAKRHPDVVILPDVDRRLEANRLPQRAPRAKRAPIRLADRRLEPVPSVVALLEDVLRRARAGEIRGVAIAATCDARCDGSAFDLGDGGVAGLNLAIDRLKGRLLAHHGDD